MERYTAVFKPIDPDKVVFELTVKMSLGDWKKLKDQLNSSSFPAFKLAEDIRDMVIQAGEHFKKDSEGLIAV